MTKLVIRVDGNNYIGLGHITRCCAMTEILAGRFRCVFFVSSPSHSVCDLISDAGGVCCEVPVFTDMREESEWFCKQLDGKEIVVLDGYHFGSWYQQKIVDLGCRLVCVDDIYQEKFVGDVVINHSGGARSELYEGAAGTQFFLGFPYCLLRAPFLKGLAKDRTSRSLLISLGGADPENKTLEILCCLKYDGFDSLHVLLGGANKYVETIKIVAQNLSIPAFVHHDIAASEVATLMELCSHAILTPSGTALEYMHFSGVVYLKQIADNQTSLNSFLKETFLAADVVEFGKLSPVQESAMIKAQQATFDRQSPRRVKRIFENLDFIATCYLKPASGEDVSTVFKWVNDPLVRKFSFNEGVIGFGEHLRWFEKKIADKDVYYWIFLLEDRPVGQIRFDWIEDHFLVSYLLDPDIRGRGLGSFFISKGIRKLLSVVGGVAKIKGHVKAENVASCLSFERLAFQKEASSLYANAFEYTIKG